MLKNNKMFLLNETDEKRPFIFRRWIVIALLICFSIGCAFFLINQINLFFVQPPLKSQEPMVFYGENEDKLLSFDEKKEDNPPANFELIDPILMSENMKYTMVDVDAVVSINEEGFGEENSEPQIFAVELLEEDFKEEEEDKICVCVRRNCGCCEHVTVPRIHLDDNVCLNMSYVAEDIGIKFSLSINNHTYYTEEISVRNPPPICFEVPQLHKYASLCVRFYDMDASRTFVSGCAELEAELLHVRIARAKLGCFRLPI